MTHSRGSQWRRWDLHIHTPSSFESHFSGWDNYIDALEQVRDVSVIGITDYFSIEGYKEIRALRKSGKLSNFDLVLPNIEFRLDTLIPTRSASEGDHPRRLNFHVIFSNEVDTEDIENQFIHTLDFTREGAAQGSDTRKLTRSAIEETGKLIKATNLAFAKDSDYQAGCKNITVYIKDIVDALQKSCFKDRYLLVLPTENWEKASWEGQSYLIKKNYLQTAHALFCSNPSTIAWALGRKDMTEEEFIQEFGALKASLHGSDAHSIEKICKPDLDRFCWIKADPTFEGLRQIIYEPAERVRIQPTNPAKDHKKLYIDSVSFEESSNFPIPKDTTIPFNKDLVAIIGGRGSGKSALAECIAYCFDRHVKNPINGKDRFIPYFKKHNASVNIKLTLGDRDGNESAETRRIRCDDPPLSFPFEYLGQNKIEEYAMDDEQIHKLISDTALTSSSRFPSYKKLIDQIENLETELHLAVERVIELTNRLDSIDLTSIVTEKEKKETEYRLLSSEETKDLLKELASAKKKQTLADELLAAINNFKAKLDEFENQIITSLTDISQKAQSLEITWEIPELNFNDIALQLQSLTLNDRFKEIDLQYESLATKSREKLPEELDISVEHVSALTTEIRRLEKTIEDYDLLVKELDEAKTRRIELYKEIQAKYEELRETYQAVLDDFLQQESSRDILSDLHLTATLDFDLDGLYQNLFEYADKRRCRTIDALKQRYGFYALDEFLAWLETSIDSAETYEPFSESIKHDIVRLLFKPRLQMRTKVELSLNRGPVALDKLSLGQKGTVVLKLFLATNNCPIIFDQPEDHLDNEFISDILVPTFLEAKQKRQVIMITHNANLVVNADAEQVIVADFGENGIISYHLGSIEDRKTRDRITNVLEGGADAFAKRERKLRLNG